jgi:NAD(P)H dehydrogenase (quinone)
VGVPTFTGEARHLEVLIVSYSRYGVLEQLATCIAAGASSVPDVQVSRLEVEDAPLAEVRSGEAPADGMLRRTLILDRFAAADALIVGAPAYFGSMAAPVKRLFEDCLTAQGAPPAVDRSRPWRHHLLRDRVGAAFTASATPHGGNELALHSILTLFMHLGMLVVTPGQADPILENPAAPYGATAIAGAGGDGQPSAAEQDAARALGVRVAHVAAWVRLGRTEWEKRQEPRRSVAEPGGLEPSG